MIKQTPPENIRASVFLNATYSNVLNANAAAQYMITRKYFLKKSFVFIVLMCFVFTINLNNKPALKMYMQVPAYCKNETKLINE